MSERYLQSLAILLAGFFSAERSRSKGVSLSLSPPKPAEDTNDEQQARSKAREH